MTEDDKVWHQQRVQNRWELPPPAVHWKRLPVIRHIRAAVLSFAVELHYSRWASIGCFRRTGYDRWVIYAIYRGWC
jgi:hypothetical protein